MVATRPQDDFARHGEWPTARAYGAFQLWRLRWRVQRFREPRHRAVVAARLSTAKARGGARPSHQLRYSRRSRQSLVPNDGAILSDCPATSLRPTAQHGPLARDNKMRRPQQPNTVVLETIPRVPWGARRTGWGCERRGVVNNGACGQAGVQGLTAGERRARSSGPNEGNWVPGPPKALLMPGSAARCSPR